jgi:hypothetical protein
MRDPGYSPNSSKAEVDNSLREGRMEALRDKMLQLAKSAREDEIRETLEWPIFNQLPLRACRALRDSYDDLVPILVQRLIHVLLLTSMAAVNSYLPLKTRLSGSRS